MPKSYKLLVKEELKQQAAKKASLWEVRDLEEHLRKKGIAVGKRTLYKCLDNLWKNDASIHKAAIPTNQSYNGMLGFGRDFFNKKNIIGKNKDKKRKNILWCYYYDDKDQTPWQVEEEKELRAFDKTLFGAKERFELLGSSVKKKYLSDLRKNRREYKKKRSAKKNKFFLE